MFPYHQSSQTHSLYHTRHRPWLEPSPATMAKRSITLTTWTLVVFGSWPARTSSWSWKDWCQEVCHLTLLRVFAEMAAKKPHTQFDWRQRVQTEARQWDKRQRQENWTEELGAQKFWVLCPHATWQEHHNVLPWQDSQAGHHGGAAGPASTQSPQHLLCSATLFYKGERVAAERHLTSFPEKAAFILAEMQMQIRAPKLGGEGDSLGSHVNLHHLSWIERGVMATFLGHSGGCAGDLVNPRLDKAAMIVILWLNSLIYSGIGINEMSWNALCFECKK